MGLGKTAGPVPEHAGPVSEAAPRAALDRRRLGLREIERPREDLDRGVVAALHLHQQRQVREQIKAQVPTRRAVAGRDQAERLALERIRPSRAVCVPRFLSEKDGLVEGEPVQQPSVLEVEILATARDRWRLPDARGPARNAPRSATASNAAWRR